MAVSLDDFCRRLADLRLDRSGGRVKPYKPLLVAAVVILIHKGKQPSRNLFLDGGLRSAFQQLVEYLGDDLPPVPLLKASEGEQITERALEEHLELHWDETPFAHNGVGLARREVHGWPGRQVFTPVNAIDLLGYEPAAKRWWVFELKRRRSADRVVGQVSRYLGWIAEERRGHRESAVGAIIVRKADAKLRYAVKAHDRLSLWEFDERLEVRQVA